MSTPIPSHVTTTPVPVAPLDRDRGILIVSHSSLFYWWPVWAVGFAMCAITAMSHEYMVTVPVKSTAKTVVLDGQVRDAYVLPPRDAKGDQGTLLATDPSNKDLIVQPHIWMSPNKNLGVVFCVVLLLVIAITNIPLRGLWSVIAIVFIISLVIIFGLLDWWTVILHHLSFLDIRINAAGYGVISGFLFILWLIVMLLFDHQIYMVFTPGQLRVRQEVGDAETAYDTTGMTIQKQRSDLFRHWILGIGSGDLIVKTSGANQQEFHMNNVLFVGRKVRQIEEMLRSRQVVGGQN